MTRLCFWLGQAAKTGRAREGIRGEGKQPQRMLSKEMQVGTIERLFARAAKCMLTLRGAPFRSRLNRFVGRCLDVNKHAGQPPSNGKCVALICC